ncbi:twin-arginine translocase subunit TatB [Saccharobesus litoralis]|uniref:Sec-independent protein translocase protein TatB n=1 Tax=Saccharobesus litoralis TaxID=2172099 RepID=A0A2S0VRQ5_9ALTE|nr:Sec-independent protein translocase protein TatB [Saccharobesus litoralis]AWB66780.1 twin-arginine translocase subunit TatB [Saccharobesus litoralis]
MFDIGFWELVFIGVIALLVLGPDKLPGAIRSFSKFVSSFKQTVNSVKSEINHELRVHELHEQLKQAEQKGMQNLTGRESNAVAELEQAAKEVNSTIQSVQKEVNKDTNGQ